MTTKILWIEDGALSELATLTGPLNAEVGKYSLSIVPDITTAIDNINNNKYDIIIFDIRLLPGNDMRWRKFYYDSRGNKIRARLGLWLIYALLNHNDAPIKIENPPGWITPDIIGIMTVEELGELHEDMEKLHIKNFAYKHKDGSPTALIEFVERLIDEQKQLKKL